MASLPGFRELGNGSALYEPADAVRPVNGPPSLSGDPSPGLTTATADSPALIIICSWIGGATPARIARFTEPYKQLFPRAHILIIRTAMHDLGGRSDAALDARLAPARHAVLTILGAPATRPAAQPGILLHILSTGGCRTALRLLQCMPALDTRGTPLPVRLAVLDCAPGDATAANLHRAAAAAVALPQPPARPSARRLAAAVGLPLYVSAARALHAAGLRTSIADMRAQLLDAAVLPAGVPRLYLFSLADDIVPWRAVESHRREARRRGVQATAVVFVRARHLALLREDPERYWGAVGRAWRPAVGLAGEEVSADLPLDRNVEEGWMLVDAGAGERGVPAVQPLAELAMVRSRL